MKRFILLALLTFLLPWSALAKSPAQRMNELKPAQAALAAGDYPLAYRRYLDLARSNPLAPFMVGLFHQQGWGRKVDASTACTWFEKAAQKHVPMAEHLWADCLAKGTGRTVDIPAALVWYGQAADHGHLISLCAAADHYIKGNGVAQDVARGIALCTQVAQARSSPAMVQLARYYQEGKDVPLDLASARAWYQQAAAHNNAEGQYQLGLMLAKGEGDGADMDGALFQFESAASQGYAPAYLPTAQLYAAMPPRADSGALAPEHLAKIYLWIAAAKARDRTADRQDEITRIAAMAAQAVPEPWRPQLDKQLAEHLAQFPPTATAPVTAAVAIAPR